MTDNEQRDIIGQVMIDLAAAKKLLACLESKADKWEDNMQSVKRVLRARSPVLLPEIPSKENAEKLISDIRDVQDKVLRLEVKRDRFGV